MLDQMARDYSANIREAEAAVAQTIGNVRMAEDDYARAVNDANSWGNKAVAASRKAQEPGLAAQNEVVDKLKGGLDQMRRKLHELTAKRNQMVNRARVVATQSQVNGALKSLDAGDPTSVIGRYEETSAARRPPPAACRNSPPHPWRPSSTPWKDLREQTEVEARPAGLKSIERKALGS